MLELELKEKEEVEEKGELQELPSPNIGTLSEEEAEAVEKVTEEPVEVELTMPPKARHLVTSILATIDLIGQQFHEDLGGYLIGRPIPGGGMILFVPEEVVYEVGYLPYSPATPKETEEAIMNLIQNSRWFKGWVKGFLGIDVDEVLKKKKGREKDKYMKIIKNLATKIYSDIL